ncbi:hypothetical protein BVC80_9087g87 [Macleaya cordata]|uniref:Uncharacterized protein n=1 Tax=Macleaya cordata TaxID=56857 RepID=A0A200PQY5_MACCD|nr:hypothetical protein BVC80_9087g87 [Macleaya cordata]
MAKDRKRSTPERNGKEDEEEREKEVAPSKRDHERKSKRKKEYSSEDEDEDDHSVEREKERKHSKIRKKKRSRSSKRSSRRRYSDEDSSSSSYESDSEMSGSDSESDGSDYSDQSEDERRRRKRKERKRKEREYEKEKRRRRREKERKGKKKDKDGKDRKKKKKKKEVTRGAVTNSWGKYGIIRETDMWNKRPEFNAWLSEVKQVNLETLPNWEEKQMFKQFMEDHNTATFPSKKYYSLDAYHRRQIEKEMKKGYKRVQQKERTVFNDEEQRRLEMMQVREKQKEQEVESLKIAMQSGMAQAMKEQAQLREEMAYQYKLGNFDAAAAIQRRLDPDVAQ